MERKVLLQIISVVMACAVFFSAGYWLGSAPATDEGGNLPLGATPHNSFNDPVNWSGQIMDEIDYVLANINETHYEHHPALGANISRPDGIYMTDCSGYVDYVLNLTVPDHYGSIQYYTDNQRPLAEDLYGYFMHAEPEDGWMRVRKMADARPGDVLAYKHPIHDPNTGHVMFIYSTPVASTVNDNEYWVWVSDSTASHHAEDPRETTGNGVGKGKMWFGVDNEGRPIYFRWSSVDGEKLYYPISIGRAVSTNAVTVSLGERVVNEAEYIVNMQKLTTYWHHRIIEEENFVYIADCSGFVGYVLENRVSDNYYAIEYDRANESRPLAIDYYRFFNGLRSDDDNAYWDAVPKLADARAGDIIAYAHDPPVEGSTGHVMIIDSAPKKSDTNANEYWVWIIDSAMSGHGSDTRDTDDDNVRFEDGIGRGKMWFGVDSSGKPIYYRWSSVDGDKHYETLAVGHPTAP